MKFLVIVLCLLAERFLVHQLDLKKFQWFSAYTNVVSQFVNSILVNPIVLLAALVIPLVLLIGCVSMLLSGLMFGMVGLFLHVIILYYCLGPINAFYPVSADDSSDEIGEYLINANEQLFGVLFWYLCFGVVGVVTYRLLSLCKKYTPVASYAVMVFDILNWIPARITALCYLLVGNFQHGMAIFGQRIVNAPADNGLLLSQCGIAALDSGRGEPLTLGHAQTHVEHAALLWVFLLAIYTFVV